MNPKATLLIALMMVAAPLAAVPVQGQIGGVPGGIPNAFLDGGLEGEYEHDPQGGDPNSLPVSTPHTEADDFDVLYPGGRVASGEGINDSQGDPSQAVNLATKGGWTDWGALGKIRGPPTAEMRR